MRALCWWLDRASARSRGEAQCDGVGVGEAPCNFLIGVGDTAGDDEAEGTSVGVGVVVAVEVGVGVVVAVGVMVGVAVDVMVGGVGGVGELVGVGLGVGAAVDVTVTNLDTLPVASALSLTSSFTV